MKRAATLLAISALLAMPAAVSAADETFTADLTPEAEVPPATGTSATGSATVTIRDDDSIDYEVTYQDLTGDAVAAHIHFGGADVAGPVMLPLAHGPSPFSGTLTEADFAPVEDGPQTYQEALDAIRDGTTYINVHTEANPGGEIRGQLEALPPTSTSEDAGGSVPVATLLLLVMGGSVLLLGLRRFATPLRKR
jgi:hypothetical protein